MAIPIPGLPAVGNIESDVVYAFQLFPGINIDKIAVFDSNFDQVFENARPTRVTVRQSLKPMEHPLENGQIISDYKIILPVEITIPLIVTSEFYRDTYAEILNLFNNSEVLTVQTNVANYANMFISEMPHEERAEMFDAISLELHLKQILVVQPASNYAPIDPTQVNTQALGQQSATDTTFPTNSSTNSANIVRTQFLNGGTF